MKKIIPILVLLAFANVAHASNPGDSSEQRVLNDVWDQSNHALSTSAVAGTVSSRFNGRKTVATAGTAEALSGTATPYVTLTIMAEADNTGVIAVGTSSVIAALATRNSIYLNAGDSWTTYDPDTLNQIYLDTTVSGDGVTYFGQNA